MKGTTALNAERALKANVRRLLSEYGYQDPVVERAERANDRTVVALFHYRAQLRREAMTVWVHDDGDHLEVPGFCW